MSRVPSRMVDIDGSQLPTPFFNQLAGTKTGHGIIPRSEEEKDVTILIERQELIGGREDRFCGQLEEVIEELLVLQNVGPVTPACHVTSQELFKGV